MQGCADLTRRQAAYAWLQISCVRLTRIIQVRPVDVGCCITGRPVDRRPRHCMRSRAAPDQPSSTSASRLHRFYGRSRHREGRRFGWPSLAGPRDFLQAYDVGPGEVPCLSALSGRRWRIHNLGHFGVTGHRGFLQSSACGHVAKWDVWRFKSSWCSASVGLVVFASTGMRLPVLVTNQTTGRPQDLQGTSNGWR